jgi:two-component system, LytTR family, response regulator
MIKAIIVDDEQHCIDRLKGLLEAGYSNSLRLLGTFDSVPKGYKAIKELSPDLVFLDVQIHEKTGFDLLKELGDIDFEVIFTTAYDKFAVQAFKFSALDYLLKPVDKDDLKLAMDKFVSKTKKDGAINRLDNLLLNLKSQNGQPKRIIVPTTSGFEVFDVPDIIRCESDVNYTTIYLKNKQKLVVAKTLKEFEEMLTEHGFFRVHNSHLINLTFVKSYNKGKGGSVVLSDGMEIEVSTRRKDDFLKEMMKH